jgi:hypothetical protein
VIENNKKMIPIMASTLSTGAKKLEQKTNASMSKQTYIASALTADERVLAELATKKLVQVIAISWYNQDSYKCCTHQNQLGIQVSYIHGPLSLGNLLSSKNWYISSHLRCTIFMGGTCSTQRKA